MQCPHCQTPNAIFQALDTITFSPTVENWQFDKPPIALMESGEFCCILCEERIRFSVSRRTITKIESVPIWDEKIEKIIANCKLHRDEVLPDNVFAFLRKSNFKRISKCTPCEKVISILLEQKP